MSTTITREHMKTVADWLDAGGGPLGTERMEYRQSEIDCGYACCAVGALSIVSGRGHADAEVFALIAGVELPALGRCAAVAAQLCRRVEQNVGPIIAALFRDDWDSARRAAVATQQPGGSGVWLDGIQHGQSGGDAWLYDNAESHGMRGGTLYVRSPRAKVVSHLGGTVIWQDYRDCRLVETRREVKPDAPKENA